jgi:hypothetical protein
MSPYCVFQPILRRTGRHDRLYLFDTSLHGFTENLIKQMLFAGEIVEYGSLVYSYPGGYFIEGVFKNLYS